MKSTLLPCLLIFALLGAATGQAVAQAVVRTPPAKAATPTAAGLPAAAPAETLTFAEEMPHFRRQDQGLDSVQLYVQRHLRYPDDAFIGNASGRVYVGFVVGPAGKVEQVKVLKGVYPSLDQEAVRAVAALPAWYSAGRQHGRPVSVAYTLPVVFQMEMAMLAMRAQTAKAPAPALARPTVARTGPSFPGGPDSLRAFVRRYAQQAGPAAQGRVFVEFDIDNDGHPLNIKTLLPASEKERATPAAYAAASHLVEQFPAWLPGPANGQRHQLLPLAFGAAELDAPAFYTDLQYPTFPGTQPTLESLTAYIQRQAQYPAAAMDRNQQGRVYAYFEVSAAGEVEHVQIIGSVAPLLDAEVLRVMHALPRATTPPINVGQAVRAAFTLPVSFVMR